MKRKFRLLNLLSMMSCITLFFFNNIFSQNRQAILHRNYPLSELQKILISRQDWHPFPTSRERDSWKALPEEVRQGLISRGEKYLNYQWPALPASLFLDFTRTDNRENFQKTRSARREALCGLVLAECTEGNGRFIDDIVNGIWVICEESYWGVPAHLSLQAQGFGLPDVAEPTVDLFASETGSLLAWTSYLDSYPLDGGCDEGPGYWNRAGVSLFDCLELLYSATNRTIDIYNESLIQEIGRYIYRAYISERYFINFADASDKVSLEADLAYRYAKRIGNFIVYMHGLPMIIDVGVETHTRKNFSAQRYEIWTMQSAYHNLPTIGRYHH